MTQTDHINTIEKALYEDKDCKVFFKLPTRTPHIGKFVLLSDHDQLMDKGMIRFRPKALENSTNAADTRIMRFDTFSLIEVI